MNFYAKTFEQLTNAELYEILKSRAKVFFLEQKIQCLDMDDMDYQSTHFFLEEEGRVIAYLRAFFTEEGALKIGRVLTVQHGNGLGKQLMEKTIAFVRENMACTRLVVDAQKQAAGFYEKMGFVKVSDDFLEEGILHIAMEREI